MVRVVVHRFVFLYKILAKSPRGDAENPQETVHVQIVHVSRRTEIKFCLSKA